MELTLNGGEVGLKSRGSDSAERMGASYAATAWKIKPARGIIASLLQDALHGENHGPHYCQTGARAAYFWPPRVGANPRRFVTNAARP